MLNFSSYFSAGASAAAAAALCVVDSKITNTRSEHEIIITAEKTKRHTHTQTARKLSRSLNGANIRTLWKKLQQLIYTISAEEGTLERMEEFIVFVCDDSEKEYASGPPDEIIQKRRPSFLIYSSIVYVYVCVRYVS